jgi:F0F1-type ATP synthase alpha subunit
LVESRAPSIIVRTSVNKSLETGLKVVDSLVPIGHGQRELIIGIQKQEKLLLQLILFESERQRYFMYYVAIGQKRSSVARIAKLLNDRDCMKFTIL